MEQAHRKVEVQSLADLSYIIDNITRASRDRKAEQWQALTTDSETDRPDSAHDSQDNQQQLRQSLDIKVQDYIDAVVSTVKQNIAVNKLEEPEITRQLQHPDDAIETDPYDSKLASKVQKASAEVERLINELASRRRVRPSQVAERYRIACDEASKTHNAMVDDAALQAVQTARQVSLDIAQPDRTQQTSQTWDRGLDDLVQCKARVKQTMEKLDRARLVIDLLEQRA